MTANSIRTTKILVLATILGTGLTLYAKQKDEPRSLYTYSFGGIEEMEVENAVTMLQNLGYAGIAVAARGESELDRLDQFYRLSEQSDSDFKIVSAFMAHRFDKFGFSDEGHKAAIDRMESKGGTLWVWVRDAKLDGSITKEKVESFITGIFEYAKSKGVKIVLYPHYNTYYPTVEAAMPLVKKINHPSFQVAINLCHELMSDKGDSLARSFELAKGHIAAVILSGSLIELDRTSVSSMNYSTIMPLDESIYDLRPFMRLIKNSDYQGPIGFINFRLPEPADYLERSMTRWEELCDEIGLYKHHTH